jgi:hypothetical protein
VGLDSDWRVPGGSQVGLVDACRRRTGSRPTRAQHPRTEFYREEFIKHQQCLQRQRPYYSEGAITDGENRSAHAAALEIVCDDELEFEEEELLEAAEGASVVAVAPANAEQAIGREQRRMLGGLSFTDLRRSVIDRMISAGGWVVNDRQREMGGHRVFEVIAQTPATSDGKPEQLWNFYFTEVNGRVYSLTTRTTGGLTEKLAGDAEKFLSNFQPTAANRDK